MFDPKLQQLVELLNISNNQIYQEPAFLLVATTHGIGILTILHPPIKKKARKMSHAHIIICNNKIIIEPTKQVKTSEKKKTLFIS